MSASWRPRRCGGMRGGAAAGLPACLALWPTDECNALHCRGTSLANDVPTTLPAVPWPPALCRHVRNLTSAAELLDGSSRDAYADAFRWVGACCCLYPFAAGGGASARMQPRHPLLLCQVVPNKLPACLRRRRGPACRLCAGGFVFLDDQHTLLFTTLTKGTRRADKVGGCALHWWQAIRPAEPAADSHRQPSAASANLACRAIKHTPCPLLLPSC